MVHLLTTPRTHATTAVAPSTASLMPRHAASFMQGLLARKSVERLGSEERGGVEGVKVRCGVRGCCS